MVDGRYVVVDGVNVVDIDTDVIVVSDISFDVLASVVVATINADVHLEENSEKTVSKVFYFEIYFYADVTMRPAPDNIFEQTRAMIRLGRPVTYSIVK